MTDIDNCEKAYLIIHNKDLIEILKINIGCYSSRAKIKYIRALCDVIISKKQSIIEEMINENIENYLLYDSTEFKDFLKENEGSYVIIDYKYNNTLDCGYILPREEISHNII